MVGVKVRVGVRETIIVKTTQNSNLKPNPPDQSVKDGRSPEQ